MLLLALVLLAAVLALLSGPLRAVRSPERPASPELAELETAREAKYREIRDAELDFRTGKLSQADYEAVDAALRAEALAILDRLQRAEAASTETAQRTGTSEEGATPRDA